MNKPDAIREYNRVMPGVDGADQKRHVKTITREQQKNPYKKLFQHFVDVSLVNAFVIMSNHHPSFCNMRWETGNKIYLEHSEFRLDLIKQIIRKYKPTANRTNSTNFSVEVAFRLNGFHYKQGTTVTDSNNVARGRCKVCKKFVSWKCLTCNVYLCKNACYERFHTKEDYKF
jgi:hypothetical protein